MVSSSYLPGVAGLVCREERKLRWSCRRHSVEAQRQWSNPRISGFDGHRQVRSDNALNHWTNHYRNTPEWMPKHPCEGSTSEQVGSGNALT